MAAPSPRVLRIIVLAPTLSIGWSEATDWGVTPIAIVTPLNPHAALGLVADRVACTFGLTAEQRDRLMPNVLPTLATRPHTHTHTEEHVQ